MKRMKRAFKASILASILLSAVFSVCYGQQPRPLPPAPRPSTDLYISKIYGTGTSCPCPELAAAGALFMNGIAVIVANGGAMAAGGTLKLTFFDLSAGSTQTRSVNVPPIAPNAISDVLVISTPTLIKKSSGIKAEINVTGWAVDVNLANNVMTVNTCALRGVD